jgi:hypothetical protein
VKAVGLPTPLGVDGYAVDDLEADTNPQEEFTYADVALDGLCKTAVGSARSIWSASCGDPCEAPPRSIPLDRGCSLAATAAGNSGGLSWLTAALALATFGQRRRAHRNCAGDFRDRKTQDGSTSSVCHPWRSRAAIDSLGSRNGRAGGM